MRIGALNPTQLVPATRRQSSSVRKRESSEKKANIEADGRGRRWGSQKANAEVDERKATWWQRSALHLVGVYDFATLLLAFILGYQDEALALARVHRLAFVVEALASALTLAAIDAKTSY